MKKNTKFIGCGLGILGAAVALVLGVTTINTNLVGAIFNSKNTSDNRITLNSSNKVTSAGDHIQRTAKGNNVTFTYSGVANATSGHVTLNANGSLENKDHIRSITSFRCDFANGGALTAQLSYGGDVWGDSFALISNQEYQTGSYPYFIKFTATSTTTITSLVYNYSCLENSAAHEGESGGDTVEYYQKVTDAGSYSGNERCLIVYEEGSKAFDGSLTTLDKVGNTVSVSILEDRIEYSASLASSEFSIDSQGHIISKSGYYIGNDSDSNALKTSTSTDYTNTISIDSDGNADIKSDGGAYLRFNSASDQNRFRYYKTSTYSAQKPIAIYEYVSTSTGPSYDEPDPVEIGFTVTNKTTLFKHTDVFDSKNGLTVVANMSDGSQVALSKGSGLENYSYIVKDSNDQVIDTSVAFDLGDASSKAYTVTVSYKNFIPSQYQITVNYEKVLSQIIVNSANTIFNTSQKLSSFTSSITADLKYANEKDNVSGVEYADFGNSEYNVSLELLNPSLVTRPITEIFGVAGTWKIKVKSNSDTSIYGMLDITVNAIPVTAISVTGESATVEEGSQLQLTASVTPDDATTKTVTWSSDHESIATVNTYGLVTGVSAGEARITATATDGSAIYGYIDITVTAKPQQSEFDANMVAGDNSMACTVDGNDGVKVGTSKKAGNMTITVGAGATKLSFYAAGWSGTSTVINLTGATCGTSSFSLTADAGISGSGSAYTLSGNESDYYFETSLSNISNETEITVSASTRFALWKAKYYTTPVEPVYPTSISLVAPSNTISIGGTAALEVTYTPHNTNVKNVTYSSNYTNIATVSSEGIVTGISAGNVRITATAQTASGTTSAYVDLTVAAIAVSSVSLNKTSTEITVGQTETLVATISPSNATNKNVTWISDNASIASVSTTGVVTGLVAGTVDITVTTVDGSKKATCTVTVTSSGGGGSGGEETTTYEFTDKSWGATPTDWTSGSDGNGFLNDGIQITTGSSGANGTSPTSFDAVQSVVVTYCTNASKGAGDITVFVGSTDISTQSVSTSGGTTGREMTFTSDGSLSGKVKISVNCTTNSIYIIACSIVTGTAEPTDPTSISINPSSVELAPGGSKNLVVNYVPANANQNKEVTWSRISGSSNISVNSSGVVTVSSNASAGNTAVIKATLTNIASISATCTVTVVEQTQDDQTILIYLCGSDLESNGQTSASSAAGYASGDITEILRVSNQPDDVNVVIETGGAKCWKTTHGINKSYLERYHVANRSLVRDSQETKANMGLASTLQSFVTWGVKTYPADRISLILWNHGGAMRGVCYDENYSNDCLTNSEVKTAIGNSFTSLGRSASDKFEWIGYDACLMQVQDIAEFNSNYFNYMIASEESEAGAGWDYDNWIDDAYAKKDTPVILKAIVDSFIAEQGTSSDQTLSYLNLSYMSAYKTAWESMSNTINSMINSYGKSKFQTLMKSCQYYGSDSDCEGYSYFGILDAKDVVNKIRNTSAFSGASTQINAVLTAFTNLVAYSKAGSRAGNSYGLCCFFPMKDGSGYTCSTSSVYTTSQTNFTNWRSIVTTYGD